MDKTRTIYKLRKFKNEILISILTLSIGIGIFFISTCFEPAIISLIHKKVVYLSITQEIVGVQNETINISHKIFDLFEKSAIQTLLFATESFIFILFFVRMSSRTPKLTKASPVLLCIGSILMATYYVLLSFHITSNGIFAIYSENSHFYLKIIAISLISFSNILFIQQVFKQIVLEKDFY